MLIEGVKLLHNTFEYQAQLQPAREAIVCDGMRYRYGDVHAQATALAVSLQRLGVQRGDRVAIFMDNSPAAVVAIYASLMVGAVFMPVNPLTKREKLSYLLNDAEPICLITEQRLGEVYRAAVTGANKRPHMIGLGADPVDNDALPFEAALAAKGDPRPAPVIDQDLAAIIYTSGSTGDPKGVMLSHRNMLTALDSVSAYLGLRRDDVILCALPIAFDYGLYQVLMGFARGACVVLERSFAFPSKVLSVMAHERVTVLPGVPTLFSMLVNMDLSRYDLSALRLLTNTAAALPMSHIQAIRAMFPHATLFSMYGLTECKRVSFLPPSELDRRPTSVGRGMPNEEIYLVDDEGRRLPNGCQGQLVVRGSHVMRGYWRKPDETAMRLKPGPLPGEMVLYTGDVFRTDEEGFLYFVGRSDDIIKSRGEKVSPKEVENVLYSLPGVLEAAVVGVPDELLGQAIKAYVVLAEGYQYTERDVIKYCVAHMESFMAPKYVEFCDSLPKTDTGKIRKHGLGGGSGEDRGHSPLLRTA